MHFYTQLAALWSAGTAILAYALRPFIAVLRPIAMFLKVVTQQTVEGSGALLMLANTYGSRALRYPLDMHTGARVDMQKC